VNETVVVITGAAPIAAGAAGAVPDAAVVIAADGALDHALAAGLTPAGLVGDLDSISDEGLEWARRHATITRHDPDKDHTDTELALAVASDLHPARLVLIGAGERLDHTLAAIGALGQPHLTSIPVIEGWWGGQRLRVLHGPGQAAIELEPGATLSLLALHGPCTGVTIDGVRWPLVAATLAPVVGIGLSNVAVGPQVDVRVSTGVLTILLPGEAT
jgi:thiamine pyrophosphokinase